MDFEGVCVFFRNFLRVGSRFRRERGFTVSRDPSRIGPVRQAWSTGRRNTCRRELAVSYVRLATKPPWLYTRKPLGKRPGLCELPRMPLPRARVNKDRKKDTRPRRIPPLSPCAPSSVKARPLSLGRRGLRCVPRSRLVDHHQESKWHPYQDRCAPPPRCGTGKSWIAAATCASPEEATCENVASTHSGE